MLQRIVAKITIKNGFNTSIGWNLGKKNKSIHLFDPFTSTPIIGTINKETKVIKKRKYDYEYDNKINVCLFFYVFHELIE